MSEETKDNALDKAVEQIEEAVGKVEESTKSVTEVEKNLSELQTSSAQTAKDVLELRAYMETEHGKSGADDFDNEMSKFISKAYKHSKVNKTSAGFGEKVAVDYTTTTDATAGYLVDDILSDKLFEIADVYGSILPRVTSINVPAGSTMKVNRDVLLPVATWREEQATIMAEAESTFGQASLTPVLLGAYIKAANELLESPGVGFGSLMSARMVRALLLKQEDAILRGDEDNAEPKDGLLNAGITAVNDQTDIDDLDFAGLTAFLGECADDYAPSVDPSKNQILMSPGKYLKLLGQVSALTAPAFTWADPARGQPASVYGYEIITHPAMNDGTNDYIALGNLDDILFASSGKLSIDFNPYTTEGWTHNETWLRVFTHCDYEIMMPAHWNRAILDAV